MKPDATQQGVSTTEDPRAAIYARADEKAAEESSPHGEPTEWEDDPREAAPKEKAAAPVTEDSPPAEEPEQGEAQEATPQEQPTEQMVRVKVDGVEEEVPLSKVLAQYQKNSAADRRLEEAQRTISEVKALKAELDALRSEAPQRRTEPQRDPSQLPDDIAGAVDSIVTKQLEAMDPKEYAALERQKMALLREAFRREQAEAFEQVQKAQEIQEYRRGQVAFLEELRKGHDDVDAYIRVDMANNRVQFAPEFEAWVREQPKWMVSALMAPDPSGPIEVLARYKAAKNPNPSLGDKLEAKRKLDVPPSASRRAAPPKEEEDDPTGKSYVQQLKEMRTPRARSQL